MRKSIWIVSAVLALATVSNAQEGATRARTTVNSNASATVNQNDQTVSLAEGTRISGELQNSIDVRKAKVGDEVVLKTTQAIKSDGHVVVNKGARLYGRVTDVAQKTKDYNGSRLGLLFDRLEGGSLAVPIVASITSVTSSNARVRNNDDDDVASSSTSTRSTSSSQGSGGLIGGVASSVRSTTGTVVGATTNAVGAAVRGTENKIDDFRGNTGGSLGSIQIAESSDASVTTGSVLSLRGDNMRLEKGTTLNLILNQSVTATKN
jgi:hypothetical protein